MYWLGLDVGTSGSRALLVDADGRMRYSFTASHEDMQSRGHSGPSRIQTIGGAPPKSPSKEFYRRLVWTEPLSPPSD